MLDTSGVLAWLDADEPDHQAVADAMDGCEGPVLLSPFVLAELDYMLAGRGGFAVQTELLKEVESGAYTLAPFDAVDVGHARRIMERYGGLRIGLTDASMVVLAERHNTHDILTLDRRHFRAMRGPGGRPFRLLPDDYPAGPRG